MPNSAEHRNHKFSNLKGATIAQINYQGAVETFKVLDFDAIGWLLLDEHNQVVFKHSSMFIKFEVVAWPEIPPYRYASTGPR
jgi:hypothetical protein